MIKIILTILIFFQIFPAFLLAATTSEFTITALVGEDSEPPTMPNITSVTPIATTQIDIEWSASTDNLALEGYVLLRDGLPIATTTLTNYSDSGLSPETLYSYEVYAFDSRVNVSSTSASVATSTLSLPVENSTSTPSTIDSPSSATKVFRLLDSSIIPSTNDALFSWKTSLPAKFILRWGRDDVYDGGYIINDTYRTEHKTEVSDLEPGTVYFYELIAYTTKGVAVELRKGSFKTDSSKYLVTPNVQNLQIEILKDDVSLSWILPQSDTDLRVRVVRSYLGYPVDLYDGAVVYEGKENSFLDVGILNKYETLYYTVFVISADGSVSSGAIVSTSKIMMDSNDNNSTPTLPIDEEIIPIPNFDFSVKNINIFQDDKSFNFESEEIKISHRDYFVVSIPYETLPRHLKSIIATLTDPTNQDLSYSFLLRINKERTAYEAVVAPVGIVGASRLQIEIFDFEREVVGRYRKQVNFVVPAKTITEVVFPDKIVGVIFPILPTLTILLISLLILFFFFYKKSKGTEDKR